MDDVISAKLFIDMHFLNSTMICIDRNRSQLSIVYSLYISIIMRGL